MTSTAIDPVRSRAASQAHLSAWAIAAACLLLVAGGINLVHGYTLLEHRSYLDNEHIVYSNLSFWGWVFLVWGVLQLVAGALVFAHKPAGTAMGVALATTACFLWFFMMFASPFGMLVGIIVNGTILFGLTANQPSRWHSVYD
jgi:hypothetical protein